MPFSDPTGDGREVLFPGDTIHLAGLKEARVRSGMSREQLARRAQVSLNDLAAIEKSNARVLVLTALKLARALGVSLDQLQADVRHPPPPHQPAAEPSGAPAAERPSNPLPKAKSA